MCIVHERLRSPDTNRIFLGKKLFAFVRVIDLVRIWLAVTFIFSFCGTRAMDEMYSLKVPAVILH